jgi:hypothetical protein
MLALPADVKSLTAIARDMRGVQADTKEVVDSLARRMGSLTAMMEGLEQMAMRSRPAAGMPSPFFASPPHLPPRPSELETARAAAAEERAAALEAEGMRLTAALGVSEERQHASSRSAEAEARAAVLSSRK